MGTAYPTRQVGGVRVAQVLQVWVLTLVPLSKPVPVGGHVPGHMMSVRHPMTRMMPSGKSVGLKRFV